ncbi:MAG: DUF4349 domain-containing protein [Pseudonocardia sp.]
MGLRQVWGRRWVRRSAAIAGAAAVLIAAAAVVVQNNGGVTSGGSADYAPALPSRGGFGSAPSSPSSGQAGDAARAAVPEAAPDVAPVPPGVPVGTVDRTLIRTAQVSLEVADPAASGRQVRTAVAAAGGFVTEESTASKRATLVVRVPAAALDRLLDDVATLGTVTERGGQTVDATEEVVDLDARVASQQASVARVRALLARAESIGDIVAIESELARREAELDSLTSRLAALRGQAALSTLTVTLRQVGDVAADDDRAIGFFDGLGAGWDGLKAFGLAVAVVVGFLLPFVPVVAVVVGIGWLVRRGIRARHTPAASSSPPAS